MVCRPNELFVVIFYYLFLFFLFISVYMEQNHAPASVAADGAVPVARDEHDVAHGTSHLRVVGLCGFLGAGKDTVADYLEQLGFQRASFAGVLKDVVARAFSWPRHLLEGRSAFSRAWREQPDEYWADALGMPGLTPRTVLQMWGTDVVRKGFHTDFWVRALAHDIALGKYGTRVVVTDCRFPNEVRLLKAMGGQVWRIQRGPAPAWETQLRAELPTGHIVGGDTADSCSASLASLAASIPGLPHETEWAWISHEDITLYNDGTLDALRGRVHARAVRMIETQ